MTMADEDTELVGGDQSIEGSAGKLTKSADGFGKAISQAFTRGIADGKRFEDVLKSVALRFSDMTLKMALKPLEGLLSKGIGALLGGLAGGLGRGLSNEGASGLGTPPASFGVFADGGVIASPSYFSLGQSTLGLAGEAGPEAILPLARGSDGRLGVAAGGAGPTPSVTVNITTPDAGSFRQSEVYLSGMLARAVARGQRGL
jgi:phage-related minor tail protein